jgi:hypothetical protein
VDGWPEAGCPGCSFVVDHIGHLAHLHARNTSLVLVSRAPLARIKRYKRRMGWTVPWRSVTGCRPVSIPPSQARVLDVVPRGCGLCRWPALGGY